MSARLSLLTVLSLTACSLEAADDPFDAPLDTELTEPTDGPPPAPTALAADGPTAAGPLDACPGSAVIGILDQPSATCQLPNLPAGWGATRLFAGGSPGVAGLSAPVPGDLGRFCRFDVVDPALADTAELHTAIATYPNMAVETAGPDCRGNDGQGDGLRDAAVGQPLRQAFRANIDRVSNGELLGTDPYRTAVDIALPDTVSAAAATNAAIEPNNAHGLFMASIIEDIACPGGATGCPSAVHFTQAMPRNDVSSPPDYINGGKHGTQGDLALAIYEAVAEWQQRHVDDPDSAAPRLVINLSLGFVRRLSDTGHQGRGPAQSLVMALQHASCQGALIVAASGNAPVDACSGDHAGPLAPASFESDAAPSLVQCNSMGFGPTVDPLEWPIFPPAGTERPLVYGVAGVDEHDRPLSNAREDSRSRLAALGSNALGSSSTPFDAGITGSSVSTAVVSAAAAMVWQFREDLRPDEVMSHLYDSGYGLTDDAGAAVMADYGLDGQPLEQVRRVSVCAALEAACASTPGPCPTLSCPAQAPAADGNLGGFFSAVDTAMSDPSNDVVSVPLADPDGIDATCVGVVPNNLHDPQPDLPVCARCNLSVDSSAGSADDTLKMSIEPEYHGAILGAWLFVRDEQGSREYDLSGVVDELNESDNEIVTVDIDASADAASAMLVFDLDLDPDPQVEEWGRQEQPITLDHGG